MAEIAPSIRINIDKFIAEARRHYDILEVYLYGSHAKGTATTWSDIDIALISKRFLRDPFEDQIALMRLAAGIDNRIEPHPFTRETFTPNNPLVHEIRTHGVRLYPEAS